MHRGKYNEAIKQFSQIITPDINTHCNLALTYFKAGMYEESYNSYESAMHWIAQNDAEKSHIMVAMATMTYKFQGVDSAKTLLFQSSQLSPPSLHGLYCLCVLGLLTGDVNLTSAALD